MLTMRVRLSGKKEPPPHTGILAGDDARESRGHRFVYLMYQDSSYGFLHAMSSGLDFDALLVDYNDPSRRHTGECVGVLRRDARVTVFGMGPSGRQSFPFPPAIWKRSTLRFLALRFAFLSSPYRHSDAWLVAEATTRMLFS